MVLLGWPMMLRKAPAEEQYRYRARQGTPLPFVELRAATEDGFAEWDGKTMGELQVRGPWVARQYFNFDGPDGSLQQNFTISWRLKNVNITHGLKAKMVSEGSGNNKKPRTEQ